jgi:hypothetical protein
MRNKRCLKTSRTSYSNGHLNVSSMPLHHYLKQCQTDGGPVATASCRVQVLQLPVPTSNSMFPASHLSFTLHTVSLCSCYNQSRFSSCCIKASSYIFLRRVATMKKNGCGLFWGSNLHFWRDWKTKYFRKTVVNICVFLHIFPLCIISYISSKSLHLTQFSH